MVMMMAYSNNMVMLSSFQKPCTKAMLIAEHIIEK
jgi:hypothetical protein